MMNSQVILSIEDALTLWNRKVQRLKEHIFTKRQQQSKISYLKANIKVNEVLIHLDYSENYKSQDQNEIQSKLDRQVLVFSLLVLITAAARQRNQNNAHNHHVGSE